MQAQSRLAVSGGSSSPAPEEEHEAVIRELTRGRELTAQLRAAALGALRGQGQAEATAALILQEVSRAFNVCLTIMSSPADRAPPPPPVVMPGLSPVPPELAAAPRRNREDSIPREQRMTTSPHYDGYQWRKYGQKRITNTPYPRCYYRCSFHRERGCRATKQVQQWSGGDPPEYLVMYFNDHTCDTAAWEPAEAPPPAMMLDLSSSSVPGLAARRGGGGALDQEEHERRVLVSSLACVLGAHHHQSPPPPDAAAGSAAVAVNVAPGASAAAAVDDAAAAAAAAAAGMPRLDVDVVGLGLDDMDYDVDVFGDSYVPFY